MSREDVFKMMTQEEHDDYTRELEDKLEFLMDNLKVDKTWSIKHEGHLNKNNIIFKDKKYIELAKEMKKVNDKLMENKMETSKIIKGLMELGDIIDKIELSEKDYKHYTNVIWYAIDLITVEKET